MDGRHREVVRRHDVSWREFERYLAHKGETRNPRVKYLDGELELVSPSDTHERASTHIALFVVIYAVEHDIIVSGVGSWLLKSKLKKAGLEPDECYIVGPYGRRTRPDFAIEVVHTSGGIDKLEIYRRLRIYEVWFWKRGKITVHVYRDGAWKQQLRSAFLPDLDLDLLCEHLDAPSTTEGIRAYRAALLRRRG